MGLNKKNMTSQIKKLFLNLVYISFASFLIISVSNGQGRCPDGAMREKGSKVEKLPDKYTFPKDFKSESTRRVFETNEWSSSRDNDEWLVISDRPDNVLYDKAEGQPLNEKLGFREYAWVIDEKNDWLEIVTSARVVGKRVYTCPNSKTGWIKKTKLLQWNECLKDENTNISRKAFLLNTIEKMQKLLASGKSQFVDVFDGPRSSNKIAVENLYSVFFVYKREGNRLLLGLNDSYSFVNVEENIVGWVDDYRVVSWNQRLALECNWDFHEFQLRKDDENKRIKGYKDAVSADGASKVGPDNYQSAVLWDNDPVKLPEHLMAEENPRRAVGDVFRFPVFEMNRDGYIRSGALARIPTRNPSSVYTGDAEESTLIALRRLAKDLKHKRDNLNLFFIVEATREMQPYRRAIIQAVDELDLDVPEEVNVKYGMSVYRDAELADDGRHFNMMRLTSRKSQVIEFLNNEVFDQGSNADKWTNLRWAINQTLIRGSFPEGDHNVLIVIGAHADLSYSRSRSLIADKSDLITGSEYTRLGRRITDLNMNISFIQVKNDAGNVYSKYCDEARALIVENTNNTYASLEPSLINSFDLGPPRVPRLENKNELEFDGFIWGHIKRPSKDEFLSSNEILSTVRNIIIKQYKRNDKNYSQALKLAGGKGLANNTGEGFSPLIWAKIDQYVKTKEIPDADLRNIFDEKIRFYTPVYLPVNIPGLKNPYKTVVFMPSSELFQYLRKLGDLRDNMQNQDEMRSRFFELVVEQMRQLTGDQMSQKDIENASIDDFRKLMAGLALDSGFDLEESIGVRIKDIKDSKRFPDYKLTELAERLSEKLENLNRIYRNPGAYEFSYSVSGSDSYYYWLPTELLF